MDIHFILVEPYRPENVGAAARALKTMGFRSLRLVNPCDHLSEPARKLAHGANDILENAQSYPNLESVLADIDFSVGCTAKRRMVREDYYNPESLREAIASKEDSISSAALLFGREESGLSNEELSRCHAASRVIMRSNYPSLNLSQAVMLYAYALSPLVLGMAGKNREVEAGAWKSLYSKVDSLLDELGFIPGSQLKNRILERLAGLSKGDVHLLHSVCNKLQGKLR